MNPEGDDLARPERLELPTYWFEASRSIRLSYGRVSSIVSSIQGMGPLETEIKLRIEGGAAAARELLARHGYRVHMPRTLQRDRLFDLPDGVLRQSRRMLRIRRSGDDTILTYKGPPLSGPHKSREELETSVGNADTLGEILQRLGYVPSFYYEKYRTTFSQNGDNSESAVVALDETPIGVFLELEGSGAWIDRTASTLGFLPSDYITASYAALYLQYLEVHGGCAEMQFQN